MILTFIIAFIAVLVFGYYQAKKQDTIIISEGFVRKSNTKIIVGMDFGQGKDKAETIYYLNGHIMTPKEYGIKNANGKSRIKKSDKRR